MSFANTVIMIYSDSLCSSRRKTQHALRPPRSEAVICLLTLFVIYSRELVDRYSDKYNGSWLEWK